ncbi:hypothetical protein CLU79DRAFT_162995 [Phycomyces nitens]|nr:hypothetical protein CLU79DRAFT_162995 [Phycomyces nitens]
MISVVLPKLTSLQHFPSQTIQSSSRVPPINRSNNQKKNLPTRFISIAQIEIAILFHISFFIFYFVSISFLLLYFICCILCTYVLLIYSLSFLYLVVLYV